MSYAIFPRAFLLGLVIGAGSAVVGVESDTKPRGADRVSLEAQQLWAEALFESWPTFRDQAHSEKVRAKLTEAASKAGYSAPILVSLAELELEDDRFSAIEQLKNDLLMAWAKESLRPKDAPPGARQIDAVGEALESGITRLLATSTSSADQCLLLALKGDPSYLPALERLAWSEEAENQTFAVAELRRLDPANALPWLIEAARLIAEDRFEEALALIERGNQCPWLQTYPAELPQTFQLPFPEGELAAELSRKLDGATVAGIPITSTVLSNMRLFVADLQSVFRPTFFRTSRAFREWARDDIERASRCRDCRRVERLNFALRGLGRLFILQTPQDVLLMMEGTWLLEASLNGDVGAPRGPATQQLLDASKQLRLAARDNYSPIDAQRLGRDGVPVWLTGDADRVEAMRTAAANALASSNIIAALDALPSSIDDVEGQAPSDPGCLPGATGGCALRACPCPERWGRRSQRRLLRARRDR